MHTKGLFDMQKTKNIILSLHPRYADKIIAGDKKIEFRRVEYDPTPTRLKILSIPELDDFLGDRLLEGR